MKWGKYDLLTITMSLLFFLGITLFGYIELDLTTKAQTSQPTEEKESGNTVNNDETLNDESEGNINSSNTMKQESEGNVNNSVTNNMNGESEGNVSNSITNSVTDSKDEQEENLDLKTDSKNEQSALNNSVENSVDGDVEVKMDNAIDNVIDDSFNIGINNAIKNHLSGNGVVSIENIIENNITGSGFHHVENNIHNNITVNVDIDVTNSITNETNDNSSNNENSEEEQEKEKDEDQNKDKEQDKDKDKDKEQDKNSNGDESKGDSNGDQKKEEENSDSQDTPKLVWGVDSANETNEDFYACVKENFGEPSVFGRYIGNNEGVSVGLTKEQVELIHSEGAAILPIYNHVTDARGYDNGVSHAQAAIQLASDLGIPEGVALFLDIEPNYPIDAEFIKGWYDEISSSQYKSGIYGIFDSERELFAAYKTAVEKNKEIGENTFIWTAAPNIGITTKDEAPEFKPDAPEETKAVGWQYGIDAETCNIDTNLFEGDLLEVLWKGKE